MAMIIELADVLYAPAGSEQTFSWILLSVCLAAATIGEVLEFIAGALGAKHAGSSPRGTWGALAGGIIGAILGIFIPIPIVGSLIGAIIGTFAGAILGEMTAPETTIRSTLKPATGATIGRILGTLSKIPIAILVWLALSVAAFWP